MGIITVFSSVKSPPPGDLGVCLWRTNYFDKTHIAEAFGGVEVGYIEV